MDTLQFILQHTGTVTVNGDYTVDIPKDQALEINWFAGNDLVIETRAGGRHAFSTENAVKLGDGRYLIEIGTVQNLSGLPVRFERGDWLVAGNVVINHRAKEYFEADSVEIADGEIVATRGDKMTRIVFNGSTAVKQEYMKKS